MASDMMIAKSMAEFSLNAMKSIEQTTAFMKALAAIFMRYLEKDESRESLLDFYEKGLGQEKNLKPGEKLSILSYNVQPEYTKQLHEICSRDKIAYMDAKSNTFDLVIDGKGDDVKLITNSVWIYNTQQTAFHKAVAEAKARSGYEQEVPREIANSFVKDLINDKNPMLELKDIPITKYIALRQDIQKLEPEMRFTLFPKYHEKDGEKLVDVGFLTRTEKRFDKRGNALVEPKQYNIPELMKGLMLKQQMMERNENTKDYFDKIEAKEQFKENTINELLKEKPPTINSIKKEIELMRIDDSDKVKLENMLNKYKDQPEIKNEIISEISKLDKLEDFNKKRLAKDVDSLGKEMYIVPAKVIKEKGSFEYEVSLKDSVCVGKDITVRTAGRDDLIIENENSMKNNLDKKLTEYSEVGKSLNAEYRFVVLTADEFRGIENGNINFIGKNNRLKKKNIKFLKEKENPELFKENIEVSEAEKKAEAIIDKINANKERFMLESDQDLTGIRRFDEYHESTIENIVTEQNVKEEIEESETEAVIDSEIIEYQEALSDIDKMEMEPVVAQDGFDQYLADQIRDTREENLDIVPGIGDEELAIE